MMTENEAKTKLCHKTLAAFFNERHEVAHYPSPCIGSACMAWRGGESIEFRMTAEAEFKRSGKRLHPSGEEIEGFCGLAGQP